MTELSLVWRIAQHGWAECELETPDGRVVVPASYVTDAPENLLSGLTHVCAWDGSTTFTFVGEPAEYRWTLTAAAGVLEVAIEHRAGTAGAGSLWAPAWSGASALSTFARVSVRAFDAVLHEHGPSSYEQVWGRPFPAAELDGLRSAWRRLRASGA
ncbi:hypothetical protein Q760_11245 [Cellulomonas cellasea DSM 20118]|uniref:Uncharacterized protein n=2 Tax=Cellulomonas cellasea TaxID=43670 RepID=A0A0A0B7F1_9CELL|nr:hypothetical protein Q760_11245 [Cellulomonas cellasea DSM 20118]GEA87639.1 hypothetical protein CCE01nite_15880 [Cellulomonas cellasea]